MAHKEHLDRLIYDQLTRLYRSSEQCCITCGSYKDSSRKRCSKCSEVSRLCNLKSYNLNPEIKRATAKRSRKKIKTIVFEHYGNKCNCCGEINSNFLTIDHINNDGNIHRQKLGKLSFYSWIIKNNFPDDLQLLCFNCNCGKRINQGVCPHVSRF